MKVVITGSGGQLGTEFKQLKGQDSDWTFLDIGDLDITKKNEVDSFFCNNNFDYIINCAAYTNVDKAEFEYDLAYESNEKGVSNLINACIASKAKLIHYSTDYVFDGKSNISYTEDHPTNPMTIYGKSKLSGEKLLISNLSIESIIIRTSWLYSIYGHNFVKTMLQLGKEKSELGIVADQVGSPTYARDLAKDTLKILEDSNYQWKNVDVFHYSNEGSCSWYDFAKQIFIFANMNLKVNPLSTQEFPTKAKRPNYTVLNKSKIRETFNFEINHWKDSLRNMLALEL